MSDEEDDYLSDKFLVESTSAPSASKTYVYRRREAQRLAALKNEQNRKKSRRQVELEAREEGLSKSLFERAQDEQATGGQNKALAMMMKMGFKPGESLGQKGSEGPSKPAMPTVPTPDATSEDNTPEPSTGPSKAHTHRTEPLPLQEWMGKTGIGVRKRAASPSAAERLAKMARMAVESSHEDFRDRTRREYEERRALGRLAPAQRTCATLDEKAGKEFNVLWLNPENPETFPEGLVDALNNDALASALQRADRSIEGRLRLKMKADALQPLADELEDPESEGLPAKKPELQKNPYSEEDIEEATQFLKLDAKDRLQLVLEYLRDKYHYCFWCGTQYDDTEDMENNCPGPDEDEHD